MCALHLATYWTLYHSTFIFSHAFTIHTHSPCPSARISSCCIHWAGQLSALHNVSSESPLWQVETHESLRAYSEGLHPPPPPQLCEGLQTYGTEQGCEEVFLECATHMQNLMKMQQALCEGGREGGTGDSHQCLVIGWQAADTPLRYISSMPIGMSRNKTAVDWIYGRFSQCTGMKWTAMELETHKPYNGGAAAPCPPVDLPLVMGPHKHWICILFFFSHI